MPNISYDGQSFSIDGRRVWLCSGAIHYPRVPRALWRDRIRAAKQAGLNCIETYVFWNAHEPSPGSFDFTGDLDLRAFIEMVGEEGMFAIVRPGPFICAEWDLGGYPPWLHREAVENKQKHLRLRQMSQPVLEASSRYLRKVMEQIKGLQITTPREGKRLPSPLGNVAGAPAGGFHEGLRSTCGGPIVLMQAENEWMCHNPVKGEAYLVEIARYLRENGCTVPLIVCNQLWQTVPNTIHTWNASAHLAADLRQLAAVQPEAPRLVSEYWTGWFDHWGGTHADHVDAQKHLYRLAATLGAGAQFNLFMFHGGTNFGFRGGRTVNSKDCFMTTSYDYDAPLHEGGGRGGKYHATKRIATFASQFGSVFAHLEPAPDQATLAQTEQDHPLSLVHLKGDQGQVVFLLRAEKSKTRQTELMLPNGLSLPVPLGEDRAAWLLLETNLGGAAHLDFTNLRAWAMVERKLLVLYGPGGAEGIVSLDGTVMHIPVPTGQQPAVEQHDDLTVVVLNEKQIDAAYLAKDGLVVGASKLDAQDQPVALRGWAKRWLITPAGEVSSEKAAADRAPRAPKLTGWRHASCDALVEGTADDYRTIDGPASLEKLGCDYGYGWYRLRIPHQAKPNANARLLFPDAGDRLHLYSQGKLIDVLGVAGKDEPTTLRFDTDLVVLADNLGRFNYGQHLGRDLKGIPSHLMQVKTIRLTKPKITDTPSPDPFELSDYVHNRRLGEQTPAHTLTWTVKPESRKPVILDIQGLPCKAVIKVNGEPVELYLAGPHAHYQRLILDPADDGPFTGGKNVVELALLAPLPGKLDVLKHVSMYQVTGIVTQSAEWAFARWAMPAEETFENGAPEKKVNRPMWYRATFNVSSTDQPLCFEPRGLSKGQIYLNGHNVGRFFMADEKGKPRGPQKHYYLPEPWLKTDEPNVLTIFAEHGGKPGGCKLSYRELGPWQ